MAVDCSKLTTALLRWVVVFAKAVDSSGFAWDRFYVEQSAPSESPT